MKRFSVAAVVVLVGWTSTASAQRLGGPDRRLIWLALVRNEAVQKELQMTDEQKEQLLKKITALRENPPKAQDDLNRFQEMNKKRGEIVKEVLDKRQQKRLEEIELQRIGTTAAIRYPEIAEKLNLADAQKDKMKKIMREGMQGVKPPDRTATPAERQKFAADMGKRQEKLNAALLAVLTPAQKGAFEKLQGKKFNFPARGNQ